MSISIKKPPVAPLEDDYLSYHDENVSEKQVDKFCFSLLNSIILNGGVVWKAPVIFKYKEVFEAQQYNVTVFGLRHPSTLSTSTLITVINALICNDFFRYTCNDTHFDLELHLRCIVASLRLLSVHGLQVGSGALKFDFFERLYNRMPQWQDYHNGQVANASRIGTQAKIKNKNYNNEFLIVYAQDLISSIPSDRTLAANITTRVMATATFLGHAYSKNVVEAARALKKAVEFKHNPSHWHLKYRNMDDLCLSLRTFREHFERSQEDNEEKWTSDLYYTLKETEESVVNELSEIIKQELESGLEPNKLRNVMRAGSDAAGLTPMSRGNHFVYGILDLIQQHVKTVDNGKINEKVVQVSFKVAKEAPYSFLRCKAFELLATMRTKSDVGQMPNKLVSDMLASTAWKTEQQAQKVREQWRVMRERQEDMDIYCTDLNTKAPILPPPSSTSTPQTTEIVPATKRNVTEILAILTSIEDSLSCPFNTEDEPDKDLSMLHPCGHFVSRQAWLTYESKNPEKKLRCLRCNRDVEELGAKLPMGEVRRVLAEVKGGSEWLKEVLEWNGDNAELPHFPTFATREKVHKPQVERGTCEVKEHPDASDGGTRMSNDWTEFRLDVSPRSQRPRSLKEDPLTPMELQPMFSESKITEVSEIKTSKGPSLETNVILNMKRLQTPSVDLASGCTESRPANPLISSRPTSILSRHSIHSDGSQADQPVHITGVKTTVSMRVGQKGNLYQATTISASCHALALITPFGFTVYSIPRRGATFDTICYGYNDGTYGRPKEKTSKQPRGTMPRYRQATLSDKVLCLACEEACVDIHDATTGMRRATLTLPRPCWTLQMSPSGELLAIAIENGELLLYNAGPTGDFDTKPLWIVEEQSHIELRLVTCIAFSPDSTSMSVCTMDNVIRTFHLDTKLDAATWISTYDRNLPETACRDPYYGVTGLAFSHDSSSLVVIAYAEKGYPVIVRHITSYEKENKMESLGEAYKDTNCCIAYSPISSAALMITRTGTLKLANCAGGTPRWTVIEMGKEKLDDKQPWKYCSLAFSMDGFRGLAVDRRGKVLVIDFTAERRESVDNRASYASSSRGSIYH